MFLYIINIRLLSNQCPIINVICNNYIICIRCTMPPLTYMLQHFSALLGSHVPILRGVRWFVSAGMVCILLEQIAFVRCACVCACSFCFATERDTDFRFNCLLTAISTNPMMFTHYFCYFFHIDLFWLIIRIKQTTLAASHREISGCLDGMRCRICFFSSCWHEEFWEDYNLIEKNGINWKLKYCEKAGTIWMVTFCFLLVFLAVCEKIISYIWISDDWR